jgi:hypothetical protein
MPQRLNQAKQTAILAWIETALSIEAIWDKQNGNRPALPYVSVNIISGPQNDGTPEAKYKTTDTFTYIFRRIFTLSIQAHSQSNHLALLSTLISAITLPTQRATLRAAGLSVYNNNDILPTDISELIDTGFEKRGSIDVTMAFTDEIDDIPGEIQTVQLVGEPGSKFENIDTIIGN